MDDEQLEELGQLLSRLQGPIEDINKRLLWGYPPRDGLEREIYRDLRNTYVLLGQIGVPSYLPMAEGLNAYGKWWWEAWEESVVDEDPQDLDTELQRLFGD